MDVEKYLKAQGKGQGVTIHQEGNSVFLDYNQFDKEIGTQIEPERISLKLEDLIEQQDKIQIQLDFIRGFIEQINNLVVNTEDIK